MPNAPAHARTHAYTHSHLCSAVVMTLLAVRSPSRVSSEMWRKGYLAGAGEEGWVGVGGRNRRRGEERERDEKAQGLRG